MKLQMLCYTVSNSIQHLPVTSSEQSVKYKIHHVFVLHGCPKKNQCSHPPPRAHLPSSQTVIKRQFVIPSSIYYLDLIYKLSPLQQLHNVHRLSSPQHTTTRPLLFTTAPFPRPYHQKVHQGPLSFAPKRGKKNYLSVHAHIFQHKKGT